MCVCMRVCVSLRQMESNHRGSELREGMVSKGNGILKSLKIRIMMMLFNLWSKINSQFQ